MKNTILKITGTILAIMLLTIFAQTSVSAQSKTENDLDADQKSQDEDLGMQNSNARRIEGVWNLTVTRRDCLSGAALFSGPAILTFVRGGTVFDFGAGRPPATRSPGYGVWSYQSNRRYTDAFQFFLYNAEGIVTGRQIVREIIILSPDGNSLTNTASSQILDLNGNVTSTRCSTATATRFE